MHTVWHMYEILVCCIFIDLDEITMPLTGGWELPSNSLKKLPSILTNRENDKKFI